MFIRCDRGVRMLLVELVDGGVQDFGFHFVVIGVKDRQPLVGLLDRRGTSMGRGSASAAAPPGAQAESATRQASGRQRHCTCVFFIVSPPSYVGRVSLPLSYKTKVELRWRNP